MPGSAVHDPGHNPDLPSLLLGILTILIIFMTVTGNMLVLIAVVLDSKLRAKRTSILIFNLAVADLLVGTMVMPFSAIQILMAAKWYFGRIVCRFWISMDVICCTASILTLCVISIDRFIGVTRPLEYHIIVDRGRLLIGIVVLWLTAVSIPPFTIQWGSEGKTDSLGYNLTETYCFVGNELRFILPSVVVSFFIPLVIIVALYVQIYIVVSRREQRMARTTTYRPSPQNCSNQPRGNSEIGLALSPSFTPPRTRKEVNKNLLDTTMRAHYGGSTQNNDHQHSPRGRGSQKAEYVKHKKSAKVLGLVVGAFLCCWTPFFSLYLTDYFCYCLSPVVLDIFTWVGYFNSALNPIIYALSMKSFNRVFRELILQKLCCCWFRFRRWSFREPNRVSISRTSGHEEPNVASAYGSRQVHYYNHTLCDGNGGLRPPISASTTVSTTVITNGKVMVKADVRCPGALSNLHSLPISYSFMNRHLCQWLRESQSTEL